MVRLGDDAGGQELPGDRRQLRQAHRLGEHQQRGRQQETRVRGEVPQEAAATAVIQQVPVPEREHRQRHPADQDRQPGAQ